MESDTLNLKKICRTCKCETSQIRFLFEGYENTYQSPRIDEMLMACASVQVLCGDGLPAQICHVCMEQLRNAFLFKQQVERIDADLREYVKNVKVNEIKQEPENLDFVEPLNTLSNIINEQDSTKENNQESSGSPVIPKIETDRIQFLHKDQILLTCCECSKRFNTIKGLWRHKHVHTSNLYKCSKCDKQYKGLNYLRRHEESHKVCMRKEHPKRHMMSHFKEKPFSCKTCNRVFSKMIILRNHRRRCKGDVVYPCNICNKVFRRENSLEVHKKMHDNQRKLPSIQNLDNIEHHQNDNAVFSHYSNCFEPQVEVTESMDDVKEAVDIGFNDNDHNSSVEKGTECLESEVDQLKEVKVEDSSETDDIVLEDGNNTINIECDDVTPSVSVCKEISHMKSEISSLINEFSAFKTQLKRQVKEDYSKINVSLDKIFKMLSSQDQYRKEVTAPNPKQDLLQNVKFPLESCEEISLLEERIRNDAEFRAQLIEFLSKIGGRTGVEDGSKIAYKIVDCVFKSSVLMQYSWTGVSRGTSGEKKSFQMLEGILGVFFEVIFLSDNRHTQKKNCSIFKDGVLKHAKKRSDRKRIRPAMEPSVDNNTDAAFSTNSANDENEESMHETKNFDTELDGIYYATDNT